MTFSDILVRFFSSATYLRQAGDLTSQSIQNKFGIYWYVCTQSAYLDIFVILIEVVSDGTFVVPLEV